MRRVRTQGLAGLCAAALCCAPSMAAATSPERPVSDASKDPRHDTAPKEGVGGRVISAEGSPISGVLVQARWLDKPVPIPDIAIVTDSAGRYFWKLPPGRYELTFSQEGRRLASRNVTVHRNQITEAGIRVPARQ